MPISVTCKSCGKTLKAKDSMAGKSAKCPGCGERIKVPGVAEEVYDAETVEDDDDDLSNLPDAYGAPAVEEPSESGRRPCPACGEQIVATAAKCRFCGEIFDKELRRRSKHVDPDLIRRFRREVHGLGGFWIFIGGLVLVVTVVLLGGNVKIPDAQGLGPMVGMVVGVLGVVWLALGVCACLKQMWAVYVGLVLSYLSIIGNIVNFNFCGLFMLVAVVVQAHRVIGWARQMRDAGIPLDTKA